MLRRTQLFLYLYVADIFAFLSALFASAVLARFISESWLSRPFEGFTGAGIGQMIVLYTLLAAAGIVFFVQKGHYERRVPWWQQVQQIIVFCFFAFLIEGFANYVFKTPVTRLWVGLSWVLAVPFLLTLRWVVRLVLMRLGRWSIPTLIVGGHENAIETLYAIKSEPYLKYDVAYVVLPQASDKDIAEFKDIHGDVQVKKAMSRTGKDNFIILCPDYNSQETLKDTVEKVIRSGVRYALVPPQHGFSFYGLQPSYFFGYNIVFLQPKRRLKTFIGRLSKSLIDKAGALIALILFSPLFAFIIFKVRRDGGPAFYAQERVGQNSKTFKCWKFRSMVINADEILKELLDKDPEARKEWDRDFKLKNDPRITKIGHLLRKTSLDEIPQIFNVLRGEMSLVGPRPIIEEEKKYYEGRLEDYLSVNPGITGLWQVSGRNDISYTQRVYLDSWYVRHWSIWNDIVIIIKTVFVVLGRRGAY